MEIIQKTNREITWTLVSWHLTEPGPQVIFWATGSKKGITSRFCSQDSSLWHKTKCPFGPTLGSLLKTAMVSYRSDLY